MNTRGIVLEGVRLYERRAPVLVRRVAAEEGPTALVAIPLVAILGIVLTLIALAVYSSDFPPRNAPVASTDGAEKEAPPARHRTLEASLLR